MAPSKLRYSNSPLWSDVSPLPQDDGGPNALATIAYTDEYREAMEYLRAVMAQNEFSERVLDLTAHVIGLNPAHYTVWLYRAKCLTTLSSDLHAELSFLNTVSLKFIKNYQIWHHRQFLITTLNSPNGETDFLAQMLDKDAKNYHVWSYRQWLVKHFGLWEDEGELREVERLLRRDVRNNSAWNHRWFVVFGQLEVSRAGGGKREMAEDVWQRELEFAQDAVRLAPQNESPWNYVRGLLRKRGRPVSTLREFAEEFVTVSISPADDQENEDTDLEQGKATVRSSHALDVLAAAYAEEEGRQADARKALQMLAERYDTIRVNYWNWRIGLLDKGGASTTNGASVAA